MHAIDKLLIFELTKGLPKLKFENDHIYDAYQLGKQTRTSFKVKDIVTAAKPLQTIHMDLFGPIKIARVDEKRYVFIIVDDYSRFTWVMFLACKHEVFTKSEIFCRKVQRKAGHFITYFIVIMEENLKIEFLRNTMVRIDTLKTSHLLDLSNKMVWWNEKNNSCKKLK